MAQLCLLEEAYQPGKERFYKAGTALERVLNSSPYYPRCSDNKTATLIRPRHLALSLPYMQMNTKAMVSWLIFDLDHANAFIWSDVGLPAPNLIVQNRHSKGAHLYYAIEPVCTTAQARQKPIDYMKALYRAFAVALKADLHFHGGPVAKTPGHPWWLTTELHPHEYALSELADYVDLPCLGWRKPMDEGSAQTPTSRHCLLFDRLRHFAYRCVAAQRGCSNLERFITLCQSQAQELNQFERQGFHQNLSMSSLRSTAKSVATWTWKHYTGNGKVHRKIMALEILDPRLSLQERQRLSAQRTHQLRKDHTQKRVELLINRLRSQGKPITPSAIAKEIGMSRQTVAKYVRGLGKVREAREAKEVQKVKEVSELEPLKTEAIKAERVKSSATQTEKGLVDIAVQPNPLNWNRANLNQINSNFLNISDLGLSKNHPHKIKTAQVFYLDAYRMACQQGGVNFGVHQVIESLEIFRSSEGKLLRAKIPESKILILDG